MDRARARHGAESVSWFAGADGANRRHHAGRGVRHAGQHPDRRVSGEQSRRRHAHGAARRRRGASRGQQRVHRVHGQRHGARTACSPTSTASWCGWSKASADGTGTTFTWQRWKAGGPNNEALAGHVFAAPDNLSFDKAGNMWVVSDISSANLNGGNANYTAFKNNGFFFIPTVRRARRHGVPVRVGSMRMRADRDRRGRRTNRPCSSPCSIRVS